jgi:hypothetical protein
VTIDSSLSLQLILYPIIIIQAITVLLRKIEARALFKPESPDIGEFFVLEGFCLSCFSLGDPESLLALG